MSRLQLFEMRAIQTATRQIILKLTGAGLNCIDSPGLISVSRAY